MALLTEIMHQQKSRPWRENWYIQQMIWHESCRLLSISLLACSNIAGSRIALMCLSGEQEEGGNLGA
jgi:hypothetical protein